MDCQDARESFSVLLDGDIALTERVPLEVHLRKCAECLEELENLRRKESARPATGRPRLPRAVTSLRRRPVPRFPPQLVAGVATVMLIAVLAIFGFARRAELALVFRHWALSASSEGDGARQPPPPPAVSTEPVAPSARPPEPAALASPPAPSATPPSAPAQGAGKPSPVTLPAESLTPRGAQRSASVARDARAERAVTPRESRRAQQPKESRSLAGARSSDAPPRSESDGGSAVATTGAPGDAQGRGDVVGRLLVKSRSGAVRDLAALLARAGGTTLSRQSGQKVTVVEGVVARSRYPTFARAVGRLGSWRIEAERSPLPDPVHVTVRLAE